MTFKKLLVIIPFVFSLAAFAEVDISGYFDMEYVTKHGDATNKNPQWRQHHLNLMMEHSVEIYKFFAEIEFEDATELEASDGGNAEGHGKLFVERAWADADLFPFLKVRVGQMLNSTLYQQNHYPSIIVNFTRPAIVKKVFDGAYEGMKLYGNLPLNFSYNLWTERAPKKRNDSNTIENNDGANLGAKVSYLLNIPSLDLTADFGVLWAEYKKSSTVTSAHWTQASKGFEANINWNNFTLWTEYGTRNDKLVNNNIIKAYYLIASYAFETAKGEFIPFVMYDNYRKNGDSLDAKVNKGFGVTFRPIPTLSLKTEYLMSDEYTNTSNVKVKNGNQLAFALVYFYN